MKRGEIWLVALDPAEGREPKGRRPALVVSPEPSTGQPKHRLCYRLPGAGILRERQALCDATSRVRSILARAGVESWEASRTRLWTKCWRGWRRFLKSAA